jgi:hypothetical protein
MAELWIEVRGGPEPLWVRAAECRLPIGELAFASARSPLPPLPAWLASPAESRVRESSDLRHMGWPFIELRSMRGSADQVLRFYSLAIERAGLSQTDRRPPGGGSGLRAEGTEHSLSIEIYEHKNLVFWHLTLGRTQTVRRRIRSRSLQLVGQDNGRALLRDEPTNNEYWAPLDALRNSEPPAVEMPRREPLAWSLLPEWAQFGFEECRGEAVFYRDEEGADKWNAGLPTLRRRSRDNVRGVPRQSGFPLV